MIEVREKLTAVQKAVRAMVILYACALLFFTGDWRSLLLALPAVAFMLWYFYSATPDVVLCVVHTQHESDAVVVVKHLDRAFENIMVLDGDAIAALIKESEEDEEDEEDA